MEVTRSNFKEVLPVISKAIEDSSFIAIDAEFTGLTARKRENDYFDTCEERYQKLINGAKDFTIVQFGICTFSWDDEQQQYIAKPFNFYIFPKPYNKQMPDMRFLSQSSSLDFLAGHGFDFNKWIYQGIPFLLPPDEGRLRQMVSTNHHQAMSGGSPSIPPEFATTIKLVMKKVEKFIKDPEKESLSLPSFSPRVHELVYSCVKSAHKTGLRLESKKNEDNDRYIEITKWSEAENEKYDQEEVQIEQAVGFTKVISLLSKSGKVILGHNMLLDLLHMIRLFLSPLPDNLDDFKAVVKGTVPSLIDTKVMASTKPLQRHFPRSHLQGVYERSSEAPFVKPNVLFTEDFQDYSDGTKAHEAGFDAYMIGVAFIAMASFLEKQRRDGSMSRREMDLEIIKPYLNKIFLFPKLKDFLYLNLNGDDTAMSFPPYIHDSFQRSTNTSSTSIDTRGKTEETVSSKQLKHGVSSFEVELEELSDSPEPAKKKTKSSTKRTRP